MAWNEPGDGGSKDPWGGRSPQDGPPDLDEAIKNLQKKLGAIFGGDGRGRGGSSPLAGLLVGAVVVIWGLFGFYIVEEGKQGVVLQFGAYRTTTSPGLHWFPRFVQSVEQVDVSRIRTAEIGYRGVRGKNTQMERESLMLTQDENIVDIQLAVQYRVKDAKDYLFSLRDPDATLVEATESAIREIIGKSKMDFVLTEGRGDIGMRATQMVQQILDNYKSGLLITRVNLLDAQPPEQVQHAFEDAVKAREDEERQKNEAEAYANDVLPKARGAAARQLEEANGYKSKVIARAEGDAARFEQVLKEYEKAPAVTRERMYLETVESVLSSVSKVMVDASGSSNLLYLPLDRLVGRGSGPLVEAPTAATGSTIVDDLVEKAKRQAAPNLRDRLRDDREGR